MTNQSLSLNVKCNIFLTKILSNALLTFHNLKLYLNISSLEPQYTCSLAQYYPRVHAELQKHTFPIKI